MLFIDVASDLKAAVLLDKSEQTTRWVKSVLRLILAYFRNLPVCAQILGQEIDSERKAGNITEQKLLQSKLDSFTDASHLAFGIGLAQILDEYAKVSLNAQRLWNFPGTLCIEIENLERVLDNLKDSFDWSNTALENAGIGIPSSHIENLRCGLFKTYLTDNVKRAAAIRLNLQNENDYVTDADDLDIEQEYLTKEDIAIQEICVIAIDNTTLMEVEKKLSHVCADLRVGLKQRFQAPPLIKAAVKAFHQTDWFLNDETKYEEANANLLDVIENIGDDELGQKCNQSLESMMESYVTFLELKKRMSHLSLGI